MNPTTLKFAGLFVGAGLAVGAWFLPTPAAQAAVFGLGSGLLGWVGLRRPGDDAPPPPTKPDP